MMTFLRPLTFGVCATLGTLGATAASACPDWSLTGAQLTYDADTLWVPQSHAVVAGGNVNLANCPQPGTGYVITQPDFDLALTDNAAGRELEFRVNANCDTVLLVNDATGQWHFDDDSGGNLNPLIRLRYAPAGAYDIWIGTYSPATCQATLTLETFGGAYAPGGSGTGGNYGGSAPIADPGNLTSYRGQTGATLSFTVTGATSGSVWGSGPYTDDSSLAAAAVHAGVLQPGQTGTVQVVIEPGQQSYSGSTAYGVTSSNYGSWGGGYSFVGARPPMQGNPDPGNLTSYRNQTGATLSFTVTGATNGSVWGTGVYTDDSSLATAAVHAGVLRPGETGTVQVTILPGQQSYPGTASNGVTSSNYGSWSGSYAFVGAPAAAAPAPAPAPVPAPAPTPAPAAPAGSK